MKRFTHADENESVATAFDARRRRMVTEQFVAETQAYLENLEDRERRRQKILAEYHFDIGTREEAIMQTGPYEDEDNMVNFEFFWIMNGGMTRLGPRDA